MNSNTSLNYAARVAALRASGEKNFVRATILAVTLLASTVHFQVAVGQTASPTASAARYSTDVTDIGTLMDDPAAHAIVDKFLPGLFSGDQIDMARSLTLKAIQAYAPDRISDKALSDIDVELAKLPPQQIGRERVRVGPVVRASL